MSNIDAIRQLAANLDASVADHLVFAAKYAGQGDKTGVSYHNGRIDAYADVAAQIRAVRADETTKDGS